MYILRQEPGDALVLDSIDGHAGTRLRIVHFAGSQAPELELPSRGRCPVAPTLSPIRALRILKRPGLLRTALTADGTLEVSGRPELLALYAEAFTFAPHADGDEHVPEHAFRDMLEDGSLSVVVRAEEDLAR
ncbi:MAG: hypothetical protein U0229_08680 [Anaeromyxobacter sp.]